MNGRQSRRFVEDLLRGRRPRRFPADETDAAELRIAIGLRAARPGSGAPREEFVTDLHKRLADELAETSPENRPIRVVGGSTRRKFVQGAAVAAAAAAVGVAVDRTVITRGGDGVPDQSGAAPAAETDTLTPAAGTWRTVAASDELPDGAVRAFDLTSVVGFVRRTDGVVRSVSGICTHQGCRLMLDAPNRQLNCPCHLTAFAVTGQLLTHQLPVAPDPLPQIATREVDGAVQVYAPPPSA